VPSVDKRVLIQGREEKDIRITTEQQSGEPGIQDAKEIRWDSRRWVQVFTATGVLTITGGADPNYESASIAIWPYDEVICEFYLSASQDQDIGIRFVAGQADALLTATSVRDFDTAAVLDLTGIYAATALDCKATPKYYSYLLDSTIPKWKIRLYVENDHATDTGAYTVYVYGRILK